MSYREDTIWLAGVLEGEGCFMVLPARGGPASRPVLRVSLAMTDRDVVEAVVERAPTTCSIRTYDHNRCPSSIARKAATKSTLVEKPITRIYWHGEQAERLMRRISPLLLSRRKARIAAILSTPNLSHHPKKEKNPT